MTTITLQPGQPRRGMTYDPMLPLPYGIHVDEANDCDNVPVEGCTPFGHERPRLVGFQVTEDPDPTNLLYADDDWRSDPATAVGMFPVFVSNGGMFNLTVPITSVS